MLFLTEHGITSGRAVRIYRTYGHESIAKIKANPYQLADDIRGIGFKTADELAAKLGIDRDSPYRARAAVLFSLQELASEGHCGFPESGVVEHTTKLVDIDQTIVEAAVQTAVRDRSIVREDVDGEPWLYLGKSASGGSRPGKVRASHRLRPAPSPATHRCGHRDWLGRKTLGDSVSGGPAASHWSGVSAQIAGHYGRARRGENHTWSAASWKSLPPKT